MSNKEFIDSLHKNQFSKVIQSLESELKEAEKNGAFYLTLNFADRQAVNSEEYAKDLKNQIQEKKARDKREKEIEKEPGFSSEFSGYPNIPQTPKELRRKKEIERMKAVKKELDHQIETKQKKILENYLNERNLDQRLNSEICKQLSIEKKNSIEKLQNEREDLISSWQSAQKARILKQQLDEINLKGVHSKTPAMTKDKSHSEMPKNHQKGMKSVSPVLENQASTKQLTSKIQKAIQNAKEVRKNITKSTSPLKKSYLN